MKIRENWRIYYRINSKGLEDEKIIEREKREKENMFQEYRNLEMRRKGKERKGEIYFRVIVNDQKMKIRMKRRNIRVKKRNEKRKYREKGKNGRGNIIYEYRKKVLEDDNKEERGGIFKG